MDEVDQRADVDALVDRVRRRVAERRARGDYPEDLERRLDAHFARVAARRPDPYDRQRLTDRLQAVDDARRFDPARIDVESGVPGGAAVHRVVAKTVSRQTAGVLSQVSEFALAVREALYELANALDHPFGHRHPDLSAAIDEALDRLWQHDPAPSGAQPSTRVAARFAAQARADDPVRGERVAALAARLAGADRVVDLGSGDGAFLDALAAVGVEALGVEIDGALAGAATTRGRTVEIAEPLSWLRRADDASLSGISALGFAERLDLVGLTHFVALAAAKLRPGGLLLVETFNPASLAAHLDASMDPLAVRFVHPAYLSFLVSEAGFSQSDVDWDATPAVETAVNADLPRRLLDALLTPNSYALFARR